MSTFVVRKHIALGFLGDGWQDAYVDFTPFTFKDNDRVLQLRKIAIEQSQMSENDAKKASKEIMDLLREKFIEGKGFNGSELEPITKENLEDLPMEIIVHILQTIQGQGILPKN